MASISNITVFDGAATPVSHTLTAIGVSRKGNSEVMAEWRELLPAVPNYAQVRASMTLTQLKSGVMKAEVKVVVPVMEAVTNQNASGYTAAPKVAYENTLQCTGFFAPRSTVTDRRLARMVLVNVLNNISTSVAAATSGFAPDLIDSMVNPT